MNIKPLIQYTPSQIQHLPDDEFTALMLIAGPFPPPSTGCVYLPEDDWSRIISLFGDSGVREGTTHVFIQRVRREENDPVS